MLPGEREVAGLRCSQVLELLSALLDGDLAEESAAQIRAHVGACDVCARFGAGFGAVVAALHRAGAAEVPEDVAERLQDFLDARLTRR